MFCSTLVFYKIKNKPMIKEIQFLMSYNMNSVFKRATAEMSYYHAKPYFSCNMFTTTQAQSCFALTYNTLF